MSKVFKVLIVAYLDPKGRKYLKAEAVFGPTGKEKLRRGYISKKRSYSTNYYGKCPNDNGIVKKVPLCTDKKASQEILNQRLATAAKARHGLGNPYLEHQHSRNRSAS